MSSQTPYRKERLDRGIKARSEDIFILTSWREMLYFAAPRVIPLAALVVFVLVSPAYWQKVIVFASVIGILAISFDLLICTGLISLGQGLFFGVGAYIAGYLNHTWGWPVVLTIPAATLSGALLCTLLLLPVLRLRGIYFAMVTLVLPLIFERIIEATKILGGTEGISALASFPNVIVELGTSLVVFLGLMFGFRRLISTDYGILFQGIRDNDRSVIRAGVDIYLYKAHALFLASAAGAFAGAFMTHVYMFVGMQCFALDYSFLPIAATVLGGMGSFAGPALGALILVPMSEVLREFGTLRIVFYGLLLVVFVVALPEGILHYVQRKYHQCERWVKVES